ncbi:uncharacterized protein LOC115889578 [Sitophilus oryzae]|uniref:Uncharacterized protein LOC115889578 n=1 Tax=Sitophilus oryzae TaxID=7048 RepID=A0A6J2YQF1_SITOR|nr:uncharacterized protein LOC115889578 [Sitophilus oryzae]
MPRRAQPGLLLLMAAAAVAVAPGAPCAAPAAACVPPCAPKNNSTQCLQFLQGSHKEELCGRDLSPGRRRLAFADLRLRHCCEHRVAQALPQAAFQDAPTCRLHLQGLLEADNLAATASCSHAELLRRYDCAQNYSIAYHCQHCKVAYRRWICSALVPHFGSGGVRIPPCLRLCQNVEQQCPYLLPDQTLTPSEAAHPTPQYAGEPNFLCLDPNIPRLEERLNSTTGDEDCCYTHCGAPGRGGTPDTCEHCPGRPPNAAPAAQPSPAAAAAATSGSRTHVIGPAVSQWMWWWWTLFLLLTLRLSGARRVDLTNCVGSVDSDRTVPRC